MAKSKKIEAADVGVVVDDLVVKTLWYIESFDPDALDSTDAYGVPAVFENKLDAELYVKHLRKKNEEEFEESDDEIDEDLLREYSVYSVDFYSRKKV
jgi:hypothetical protein